MTFDPVDAVIADYLESGHEPSLHHLTEDQRTEAAEVIDLIRDTQGVEFNRPRPSIKEAIRKVLVEKVGLDDSRAQAAVSMIADFRS